MKRIAAAAVMILFALPAWADIFQQSQDFYDGMDAYHQGDYATALEKWLPLAELGDVTAQYSIGMMYENGDGVPQDYAEAMRWYQLSAGQGFSVAQHSIGQIYYHGYYFKKNYIEAMRWYKLSAEQGYSPAQHSISVLYYFGYGVPQDYVLAHMWSNLAAAQGLEHSIDARELIESAMTPSQIEEAQRLAREWLAAHP